MSNPVRKEWISPDGNVRLLLGDCLDALRDTPDGSIGLIATDPPYHRVKMDCEWDRQWEKDAEYLTWLGTVLDEFRRVLKPNGSMYLFASPRMAWGVEGEVRKRFNWLNTIRWVKDMGWHQKANKEELRSYLSPIEQIVFAEKYGTENLPEAMRSTRERAGKTRAEVAAFMRCNSRLIDKWETQRGERDSCEPSEVQFNQVMQFYGSNLMFDDLRRPFTVTANDAYTDVWTFPTVGDYSGKHPCEKPADMIRQIVRASSKPGDTVLDCFCGSGVTGQVCVELGRQAILVDQDEHWYKQAIRRCQHRAPERVKVDKPLPLFEPPVPATNQPTLFDGKEGE